MSNITLNVVWAGFLARLVTTGMVYRACAERVYVFVQGFFAVAAVHVRDNMRKERCGEQD